VYAARSTGYERTGTQCWSVGSIIVRTRTVQLAHDRPPRGPSKERLRKRRSTTRTKPASGKKNRRPTRIVCRRTSNTYETARPGKVTWTKLFAPYGLKYEFVRSFCRRLFLSICSVVCSCPVGQYGFDGRAYPRLFEDAKPCTFLTLSYPFPVVIQTLLSVRLPRQQRLTSFWRSRRVQIILISYWTATASNQVADNVYIVTIKFKH